jgi:ribose transport system permease protein
MSDNGTKSLLAVDDSLDGGSTAGTTPGARPSEERASGRSVVAALASRSYLLAVLLAVMAIGYIATPFFLTPRNLVSVLVTSSVVSVLAVAQFNVIVTGGIDLSVGSVLALSSVVCALALREGQPIVVAVLLALAVSAVIGLVNGCLVVYGGITPFIGTLAMLSVARGLAYLIQEDRLIPIESESFLGFFAGSWGPVPRSILIALAVMLVASVGMAYLQRGRRLYAIGGNPEAARLSGLPVRRDLVLTYVTSATLAGLGGLILAAQLTQGSAVIGSGYELDSIAAAVVGGASLFGGTGDPISAVLGGLVIAAISNMMDILGVQAEAQLIVKGLVIVVAVLFTSGNGRQWLPRLFGRRRNLATAAASKSQFPTS